jgi:hypothetical protein
LVERIPAAIWRPIGPEMGEQTVPGDTGTSVRAEKYQERELAPLDGRVLVRRPISPKRQSAERD